MRQNSDGGVSIPPRSTFHGAVRWKSEQLFHVNLNMGGKSMGEKAACEKSAGEIGVWGWKVCVWNVTGWKYMVEQSVGEKYMSEKCTYG